MTSGSTMTVAAAREVDRIAIEQWHVPSIVLMENAAIGATAVIRQVAPDGDVLILAGHGNNGGDGYAIARHLMSTGRGVRVLASGAPKTDDAAINRRICQAIGVPVIDGPASDQSVDRPWEGVGVVVDCLLGTGATGDPRPPIDDWIRRANAADVVRVAVDVPTGLDASTGRRGDPTFRADHTVTFVAAKEGFGRDEAARILGTIHVVGIGIPVVVSLASTSEPHAAPWSTRPTSDAPSTGVPPTPTDVTGRTFRTNRPDDPIPTPVPFPNPNPNPNSQRNGRPGLE